MLQTPERALALVLHDVSPASWPRYREFIAKLDALDAGPLTLLIVPDYHGRGRIDSDHRFIAAMEHRLVRGDELALHGYYHRDDGQPPRTPRQLLRRRIYTHEAEFDSLSEQQALQRFELGQALFHRLQWPVRGFVPPGWLLGKAARRALQSQDFQYTSSQSRLFHLPAFTSCAAPSLIWSVRSRLRRRAWHAWNEYLLRRHAAVPLLRLGVHPEDLRYPEIEQWWLNTLTRLLHERRLVTKAEWMAQHSTAR